MLEVTSLCVRYGEVLAVDAVDLTVPDGEIVAVVGPSGSGKTSLLRAIAGLEPVSSGTIRWDGDDLDVVPPHRRGFGLMFQDHALFGHDDVNGNVGFGLRMRGATATATRERVDAMLALVGLADIGHRRIDELSGGEQQRVALARALAPAPRLLMLDEPLASVDRERRESLTRDLHRIIRTTGTPTLLVTHDLDDAFTLADSVVVLDRGRQVRAGRAVDVWRDPGSLSVARFLGVATELPGNVDSGRIDTPWGRVRTRTADGPAVVGFRASALRIDPTGAVAGRVCATWFRGDHFLVEVETANGRVTAISPTRPPTDTEVAVAADLGAAVVVTA